MPNAHRSSARAIALLAAAVIAVTIALILGLRRPPRRQPAPAPGSDATVASPRSPASRPAIRPPKAADAGPDAAAPAKVTASPATPPRKLRAPAPPAVPAKIRDEKDPHRRAELMRMHRLATARVRASLLRRRRDLLTETIAKARGEKNADRRRKLELEMASVRRALRDAQLELHNAERAVEGR